MHNAFTVDLEEWFCSHNLQQAVSYADWDKLPQRATGVTLQLLEMLDKANVKATFFVLGWLADRQPDLVRAVYQAGHQIASHGYAHQLTWQHNPESFAADVQAADQAIFKCTGVHPVLFRAPAFSIVERTFWALDILKSSGFVADSSVFPLSWHPEYGVPEAPLEPYFHTNGLKEYPMSVITIGKRRVPVSGGAYFRLLSYPVYRRLVRLLHRQGRSLLFYFHPWEMDAHMPRLRGLSATAAFRHYSHTASVARKLRNLLSDVEFGPLICTEPLNS